MRGDDVMRLSTLLSHTVYYNYYLSKQHTLATSPKYFQVKKTKKELKLPGLHRI